MNAAVSPGPSRPGKHLMTTPRLTLVAAFAVVMSLAIAPPLYAEDENLEAVSEDADGPHFIEIEVPASVEMDAIVDSYDHAAEFVDVFAKVEPSITINASDWLAFK